MCTAINSPILFFFLFASVHLVLLVDGLPLWRRERGAEDDIIAGKDFLSVIMELPALKKLDTAESTTSHPQTPSITLPTSIQLERYSGTLTPVIRESRSTRFTSSMQNPASNPALLPTQPISDINVLKPKTSSDFSNSRKVVSVSISSSVEETHTFFSSRTTSTTEKVTTTTPSNDIETAFFSIEDRQSLVAEANRNEFSVDEPEPITRNTDGALTELPANVKSIPVIKKLSDFEKTSEILKEFSQEKLKDKLPPFHHTVIYHDNPNEQVAARSISYSTVIQSVPEESSVRRWRPSKPKVKPTPNGVSEYSSGDYDESLEEISESSTGAHVEPTERNWGIQQEPYVAKELPATIYGKPEENYEVDEAVSVQTNGRTHGIQPSQAADEQQKIIAKSKNGYVIEGRKQRQYRVEERTSDGFIVGEFGIVSRDDGLLRGVRYTAEETINPKLIYDTLKTFLSL